MLPTQTQRTLSIMPTLTLSRGCGSDGAGGRDRTRMGTSPTEFKRFGRAIESTCAGRTAIPATRTSSTLNADTGLKSAAKRNDDGATPNRSPHSARTFVVRAQLRDAPDRHSDPPVWGSGRRNGPLKLLVGMDHRKRRVTDSLVGTPRCCVRWIATRFQLGKYHAGVSHGLKGKFVEHCPIPCR